MNRYYHLFDNKYLDFQWETFESNDKYFRIVFLEKGDKRLKEKLKNRYYNLIHKSNTDIR